MDNRFIQTKDLPKSLWSNVSEFMSLPSLLIDQWKKLLVSNELEGLAKEKAPEGFEGGMSKEDTDKHLAWRYNGSCGRVMLSLLDPKNKLSNVSDAYASTFAGNKVFLADLPSGSGAASISILTTLAELRKESVIPRLPLTVVIVAGEISDSARNYFDTQMSSLKPLLQEQAIWIEHESIYWDALNAISTTDLIKKMTLNSQSCHAKLLILSNFTGFLETSGKWKDAEPQFNEIFRHSRDKQSTVIWIEPMKNNVLPFVNRVVTWFRKLFKVLLNTDSKDNEDFYAQTSIDFQQPIKTETFPVRLTVVRFDLPLSKPE